MNNPKPFSKKKSLTSFKDKSLAAKDEEDKKSCVNMEELMQFEAARQRALAKISPEAYPKPFSEFVPYRIFINNVDTFNGAHFVRVSTSLGFLYSKIYYSEQCEIFYDRLSLHKRNDYKQSIIYCYYTLPFR